MARLLIPLQPATAQRFKLAILGVTYELNVRWNQFLPGWILNVADGAGNPLVNGVPMIAGQDLLAPYKYLPVARAGRFWVTSIEPDYQPSFRGLGITSKLYFLTD